jgi:hypothetical protein
VYLLSSLLFFIETEAFNNLPYFSKNKDLDKIDYNRNHSITTWTGESRRESVESPCLVT